MAQTELLKLWKQVFGDFEGFWETFFACAYEDDHCLEIVENGQLQAALYWFDCDCGGPWAYIFAVATHPDCRGRGLCRKLMEKTHAHLKTLGYHGALLVPADEGLRRMYGKMGYREGTVMPQFPVCAGMQPISAAQYAAFRRRLLPAGGVIQEGAALNLLEAIGVRFYGGQQGILAAEGTRVLEFLGKEAPAPQCAKPFAMVQPFREGVQIPSYFAFAFD